MVHIVGAGSGAPDLITVRGARLLKEADVVIYAGSLVNPELLREVGSGCEIHDSSKMTLEEVIAVIERAENEGKTTVRLHTGDPCLYGAIREQMDILSGKGIEYDICPGVSSFSGAAASLKAELTLPGVSQTVILTRVEGKTGVPEKERFAALAAHRATLAVFLSAGMLREMEIQLVEAGYPPDTPAAIVYKATWPEERKYLCTVSALAETAAKEKITKTAMIIIGDVLGSQMQNDYQRSMLYHPDFTTGCREAVSSRKDADGQKDGGNKENMTDEKDLCAGDRSRRL